MTAQLDRTAELLNDDEIRIVTLDFKRILLPTDGSAASLEAMDVAMGMAKRFGAGIIALFVDPSHVMAPMEEMMEEESEGVHRSKAGLAVAGRSGTKNGVNVTEVVKEGAVTAGILETLREYKCDAIVIGSTGRTGVKRLMLGSIAESTLREAHVPVFVVPRGSTPFCISARG